MPSKDSGSWGKTWMRRGPCRIAVHRLEHHCLDVLATADALMARDPGLLASLARASGQTPADALVLLRWCVLLHDAGKVAWGFQGKSRLGWGAVRAGERFPSDTGCAHDMVGFLVMKDHMQAVDPDGWDAQSDAMVPILAAMFFHHGRPRGSATDLVDPADFSDSKDMPRFAWMVEMADALVGRPRWPDREGARKASWLLTGLVSLVDGLGSAVSDEIMETAAGVPPEWMTGNTLAGVPWQEYLDIVAAPVANHVVATIGGMAFIPGEPPPPMADRDVLAAMAAVPPASFVPSPLQAATCTARLGDRFIAVVMDVTGSGKSEASGMLVRRAVMEGISEGGFWGLPSMATANVIYRRMMAMSPLIHGGAHSLVLAHGARDDLPLFRSTLKNALGNPVSSVVGTGNSGNASCLDWLSHGSHRSLLAHSGVGTVDQSLFAGLNSYHCGMRWVGLHRKVLVVDEVHAADPGMIEILCAVLRHHAMLGGSAILMSATLPSVTRERLLAAFSGGAGWGDPAAALDRMSYPLLTVCNGDGITETPMATRADRATESVRFSRLDTEAEVVGSLSDWSRRGSCAVWFRNTVKDAIRAHASLKAAGVPVILFHSRFTRSRRTDIETEIMRRFGPSGGPADRSGWILVSTQVGEQSLDIDFDGFVTDAAPADLIIQRLGRRRRHKRDAAGNRITGTVDGRAEEAAYIHGPDPDIVTSSEWLRSALPGTSYVYRDSARIWRSMELLLEPSKIPSRVVGLPHDRILPHLDALPLVEAVYPRGQELRDAAPTHLVGSLDRAWGENRIEKDEAAARAFRFRESYYDEATTIRTAFEDTSAMTATRTGEGGLLFLAVQREEQWTWLHPAGMTASSVPWRNQVWPTPDGETVSTEIARHLDDAISRGSLAGEEAERARREIRMLGDVRRPAVVAMAQGNDGLLSGTAKLGKDGDTLLLFYCDETGLQGMRAS